MARANFEDEIDDDISVASTFAGSLANSRTSSSRSIMSAGYAIDWDEIDSIAEDSRSCASSSMSSRRLGTTSCSSRRRGRNTNPDDNSSSQRKVKLKKAGSYRSTRSLSSNDSSYFRQANRKRHGDVFRYINCTKVLIGTRGTLLFMMGVMLIFVCGIGVMMANRSDGPRDAAYISNERQVRRDLSRSTKVYTSRSWPISVRDEENSFELLSHPANPQVTLSVPRFYLTKEDGNMETLGNGKLITRRVADMIGRTTVEGSTDPSVRTIFIGVASYRDWRCRYTVESAFARAKYPERVRVGVVDQLEQGHDPSCDVPIVTCQAKPEQALCRYRDQIDVYEMDSTLSVGPTFARHIVNRLYRGEYYNLQIDSHVTFVRDWDEEIVQQHDNTHNEMAIISTYLDDVTGSIDDMTGESLRTARQVICNAAYEGDGRDRRLRHAVEQQPEALSTILGSPQLQPYWGSGFSFSRGHFVLTVPYDPYLPMVQRDDEEISIAIRAFSHGYDIYTPEHSVCFDSGVGDENTRKSFMQHEHLYRGYDQTSLARLYGMIGMDDEGADPIERSTRPNEIFGIGQVRDIGKFFMSFGVHVREHITERKLCDFVGTGRMHRMFHAFLRGDGMGIDYNQIHFRFHELQNNHDHG